MEVNILSADVPPGPRGWGQKIEIQLLHDHVAYQIKWTHKCSKMVADILLADPEKV